MQVYRLRQDVTASDLAMDTQEQDGYNFDDTIGMFGTLVVALDPPEGSFVQVVGFSNDPYASGFVHTDLLESVGTLNVRLGTGL